MSPPAPICRCARSRRRTPSPWSRQSRTSGSSSRGSGADNIRNVTGSPTAGIDRQELIDTRPYAREWHFHILNERALYGLPRKFNVGFDGGGIIPALEDTNDIGFQAVAVKDGFGVAPGVWFRLMIGGITGHKDFARETGVVVKPADATKVADAIVRVFIDHGDRTDRNKARLKYVIDRLGMEKVLALVEEKLGRKLDRVPGAALAPRPAFDRAAHIGVHPQKQPGSQLDRRRAAGRQDEGGADARPGGGRPRARRRRHPTHRLAEPDHLGRADGPGRGGAGEDRRARLSTSTNSIRAGLVACTGNVGCKFAASDTKGHAEAIARWCEEPRRARRTREHPSHRMPSFLRAALHRRHRIDRLQGRDLRGRRHRRGLPHPCRRRLRPGRGDRAGNLPRRQSRGRAADRRAHAQGLSRASRLAAGELPRVHPAARHRCAAVPDRAARRSE